jgi:hypothetical protein
MVADIYFRFDFLKYLITLIHVAFTLLNLYYIFKLIFGLYNI